MLEIVVDKTDEDALALRELGEALLEEVLGVDRVNLRKLGINLSAFSEIIVFKALLEELLGLYAILYLPCGEGRIVEGVGVKLGKRLLAESLYGILKSHAGGGKIAELIGVESLLVELLVDSLEIGIERLGIAAEFLSLGKSLKSLVKSVFYDWLRNLDD